MSTNGADDHDGPAEVRYLHHRIDQTDGSIRHLATQVTHAIVAAEQAGQRAYENGIKLDAIIRHLGITVQP